MFRIINFFTLSRLSTNIINNDQENYQNKNKYDNRQKQK